MNEVRGLTMDLTGLSNRTLMDIQDVLSRRIDTIQRRNNGMPEAPGAEELPGLTEAYQQVNAAWFNRINWTTRKSVKWSAE